MKASETLELQEQAQFQKQAKLQKQSAREFDAPEAGTNVVTLAFRRPDGPRREVRRSAAIGSLTAEGR